MEKTSETDSQASRPFYAISIFSSWRPFLISLIGGLLGAVIFVSATNAMYHKSIGTIQLKQLLLHRIEEAGKTKMDKKERDAKAKLFSRSLEQAIKDVSRKYNVILLVSPAVVTDTPDYTKLVDQRVSELENGK